MNIIKRDGRTVAFDETKILNAIKASFSDVGNTNVDEARAVCAEVKKVMKSGTAVEDIQDIIEKQLMRRNLLNEARAFIRYRDARNRVRDMKTDLFKVYDNIASKKSTAVDLMRENANINADTPMGMMLKFGSEGSKDYNLKAIIKPEFSELHRNGDIHIHDLDFYELTFNCCQIPLGKMLKNGFSTGHGHVRQPQSILSAASLACIVLQSNQNEMFGGQSFPMWEYDLAPYVGKTFITKIKNILKYKSLNSEKNKVILNNKNKNILIKTLEDKLENTGTVIDKDFVMSLGVDESDFEYALAETRDDTEQAMQAVVHNLNTMASRAGAQVPFSSINYGTGTTVEQRMIIEKTLKVTDDGLGGSETAIFPVQVFKVRDGVNGRVGDPNFDLFEMACRVSAKRLFPNFSFLDSWYNKQYIVDGRPETEVAVMGCRTRVMGNDYDKSRQVAAGRGNICFTTINLPRLGIMAHGDLSKFFTMLEDRVDQVIEQIQDRFEYISHKHVYNFPFLMGQGIWLDSDKLKWDDEIGEVIKHGSLSVGFIGLAECLKALTGKHHGESEESFKLGLDIIKFIRAKTDLQTERTGLNWSTFATPAEGLSSRFTRLDKKVFGEIAGVTDREYYTNSFHVPVYYDITASRKIELEAPFHALCNAGAISYVEADGDLTKNVSAFEAIVNYAKKNEMTYFSVNHPVDQCPVCGYTGVIDDVCPRCGFREGVGASVQHMKACGCFKDVVRRLDIK